MALAQSHSKRNLGAECVSLHKTETVFGSRHYPRCRAMGKRGIYLYLLVELMITMNEYKNKKIK